jgi:hypothetical protein
MEDQTTMRHSSGWMFYVKAAFGLSTGLMLMGVFWLPADLWVKGYFAMGLMFCIGSAITLTKTVRDDHEAHRLVNRISEAKAERLLKEYAD